jgi:hypothetical protein
MATGIVAGGATAVVVVVAIVATIIASAFGGGANLSIGGAWTDSSGDTFTFTPSGPDSYTVSLTSKGAADCAVADDGSVNGANGHYQGAINLYPTGATATGQCATKNGTVQLSIAISANGKSASITPGSTSETCETCVAQSWTRKS